VLVVSLAMLAPLLVAGSLMLRLTVGAAPSKNTQEATPTNIPGFISAGDYIQVGINYMGTLGVGPSATDPGMGFSFPKGPKYECLAAWWWGQGFLVAYRTLEAGVWKDNVAYWQPSYGYPAPASCNLKAFKAPIIIRNDADAFELKCFVITTDSRLLITRHWFFDKHQPSIVVYTTITNLWGELRDVMFKELVDWDVHTNTVDNKWVSHANSAWASYYNATLGYTVVAGVAGYAITPQAAVYNIDLYEWDSMDLRSPGSYIVKSFEPITGDYMAGLYFEIGNRMLPNDAVTIKTVFTAGMYYPAY